MRGVLGRLRLIPGWLATLAVGSALFPGTAWSQEPAPVVPPLVPNSVLPPGAITGLIPPSGIIPAQAGSTTPLAVTPDAAVGLAPPPAAPAPATPAPAPAVAPAAAQSDGGAPVQASAQLGAQSAPRAEVTAGGATAAVPVAATQINQVLNAPDIASVLAKSPASTGVFVQQRNSIVSDPRVRGLRGNQYLTFGDNALFAPARLDLDTPVTKFDPSGVRDIVVIKGPYSALYGPGHAVLDVATLDSPRFEQWETHGRTSLNYQTNGERWDGQQSLWGGDSRWGFRVTYDILQGNDYTAGGGVPVANSFNSNNFTWAIGGQIGDDARIEFKGVRVAQRGIEFPGLYFDADLDTEAYSLRYEWTPKGFLERLTLDTYYNVSSGLGDTQQGAKQSFVQKLLAVSFNPAAFARDGFTVASPIGAVNENNVRSGNGPLNLFTDQSDSNFLSTVLGYSFKAEFGKVETGRAILGTDMRIIGQSLQENIRFTQLSGTNLNTGQPISATNPAMNPIFTQDQSIPRSSMVNPGLFLEMDRQLSKRWTVKGGGRVDFARTESDPRLVTGTTDLFGPPGIRTNPAERFTLNPQIYSTDPTNPDLDRNFTLLAGFVQSQYRLTDELTALVAFGHSERPPTLTELYASGPFIGVLQQGTSRLIGDPQLEKERLTQFDVGLQGDYRWFKGGASAFFAWINDYVTFDANSLGNGLTQVVYTNTDLATLAGAELFGQVEMTDWLTSFGTLSFVQGIDQTHRDRRRQADPVTGSVLASSRRSDPATGQFAADTEYLPQIPPLDTRLGFRIHDRSPERKWQVEFSARVVNGQNAVATSLGERVTPGFTVFNIRTYWQATEKILLTAGVENLGDKLYREHLDPISGNILNADPFFRPGTNFYFGSQFTY